MFHTLSLATVVAVLLTACQSNTVYFELGPREGVHYAPTKGGSPEAFLPDASGVSGLALSASEGLLYLSGGYGINRWTLDGTDAGPVIHANLINSVAVDGKRGLVFWSDHKPGGADPRVARCTTAGQDMRILASGMELPRAVALNPEKGLLYWSQNHPAGVWMADMDGHGARRIVLNDAHPCSAIAVDCVGGWIYWAKPRTRDEPAVIGRAMHDGNGAQVIYRNPHVEIVGLAVDEKKRRIIWSEHGGQRLARLASAKMDGTDVKTICEFAPEHFATVVTVGPPRK